MSGCFSTKVHGGSSRWSLSRGAGLWLVGLLSAAPGWAESPTLRRGDVVAFVGGSLMVAVERSAAVETLCALAWPDWKMRFRGLAWEGDTVDRQLREVNFPSPTEWLRRAGATVALVGFGAAESLRGEDGLPAFRADFAAQVTAIRAVVPRVIVVVPPPFESKSAPLPDLGARNADLTRYAAAMRDLAAGLGLPVLDLMSAFDRDRPSGSWTTDGRELSEEGQRWLARVWVRELGAVEWAERAGVGGFWERDEVRRLRVAVIEKNRLWFRYWRPTNWAFLHGDRTEQLASRDHRDPQLRWFPAEMEQYPPLIEEAEGRIDSQAAQVAATR